MEGPNILIHETCLTSISYHLHRSIADILSCNTFILFRSQPPSFKQHGSRNTVVHLSSFTARYHLKQISLKTSRRFCLVNFRATSVSFLYSMISYLSFWRDTDRPHCNKTAGLTLSKAKYLRVTLPITTSRVNRMSPTFLRVLLRSCDPYGTHEYGKRLT